MKNIILKDYVKSILMKVEENKILLTTAPFKEGERDYKY